MTEDKKLLKLDNVKNITKFLQQPTIRIAETLTGILISNTKDWKLSAGRLVQAAIKGKFLTQLGEELKKYKEEGRIKEDFFANDKNRASLYEILNFIDKEAPDEERFKAMKSVFLSSVSKDATQRDEELAYELLAICKELSSGELLILKAACDITQGRLSPNMTVSLVISGRNEWLDLIAKQIGHGLPALVEKYEEHLMQLKLISGKKYQDGSGIEPTPYFRLTSLGYKLCEFITKYK